MHRYYVSYWWTDGAAHGNGGMVIDLESPVRSAEHVTDLGIAAHEDGQLSALASVTIANIVRLDWP